MLDNFTRRNGKNDTGAGGGQAIDGMVAAKSYQLHSDSTTRHHHHDFRLNQAT